MKIETRTTLPQAVLKRLEDVPTWEGVLQYDPMDLFMDIPLTFYRIRTRRLKDNRVIKMRYPLKAWHSNFMNRNKGGKVAQIRHLYTIAHKGKNVHLYRSHLTMLCLTGFAISDRRHWVIDHINGDCSDDRPSNLQVISQSENLRKSELVKKIIDRINRLRKQRAAERRAQKETSKQSEK